MPREICKECENKFLENLYWTSINELLELNVEDLTELNICVKCFVKICNRYM
jgi:hypothetical protein